MLIIGNLTPDGYLEEPPIEDLAEEAGVTVELAEAVLEQIQEFDPVGRGGAQPRGVPADPGRATSAHDDDVLVGMIKQAPANLEKKNYPAIAQDLKQPLEEIYEAAKVHPCEFDPKPGRQYSAEEPNYITPDVYIHKVGDKYFVVANDDGLPKLKISRLLPDRAGGRLQGARSTSRTSCAAPSG